jgi:hypothetical protein
MIFPFFTTTNFSKNKITKIFYGRIIVEKATSLLAFQKRGELQKNSFMLLNTREIKK